jgi:hypothetical protein
VRQAHVADALRNPEVHQLHRAVGITEDDVLRFDVAVIDAKFVCQLEGVQDLPGDGDGLGEVDTARRRQHVAQRSARAVLHRDEAPPADFTDLMDLRYARMPECRDGSGLADEPLPGLRQGRALKSVRRHEDLERDAPVQHRVRCKVHDPGGSASELALDLVLAEQCGHMVKGEAGAWPLAVPFRPRET